MPVDGVPIIRRIYDKYVSMTPNIIICINSNHRNFFEHEFALELSQGLLKLSESKKPLGTAGEVWNAKRHIKEDFVVYYGDMLTNIDYLELLSVHEKHKSLKRYMGTLVGVKGISTEKGIIEVDNNDCVLRFEEKPPLDNLTWAAIAVFKNDIIQYCLKGRDFATHIFPALLDNGYMLKVYKSDAVWRDIGNLKEYELANQMVAEGEL